MASPTRRTLATLVALAGIGFSSLNPVHAAEPVQQPGVDITSLQQLAEGQSEEVRQAVEQLIKQANAAGQNAYVNKDNESESISASEAATPAVANRGESTEKNKFWLPAPVVGCGIGDLPVTGSLATIQPGPNYGAGPLIGKSNLIQPYIPSGHAFFHLFTINEKLAPTVEGTSVKVAWLNLRTFHGGINELSDTVLGAGINAQTSALVNTGDGPVIAAIAGKVSYPGNETCTVLPTVGSATVK